VTPTRHLLAQTHNRLHQSKHFAQLTILPNPQNPMLKLQCFSMGQKPPKCPISLGHQHHHVMHGSLDPSDSASQNVSQSVQLFLHSSRHRVPVRNNGPPLFCLKIAPSRGGSGPDLIHGSGPPESTSQMASPLVQLFLQGSRS